MILAINSSTTRYSIALMSMHGDTLAEYMVSPKGNTFTGFFPAIDMLLKSSGSEINTVNAVAVSRGPGSFTGLRVGMAAAKGIAYSMKVPLIGISAVEALSLSAGESELPVCAMITSRRDEAFFALFRMKEVGFAARQSADQSMKIKDIGSHIHEPTVVIGNDFEKQSALITESGNSNIVFARQDLWNLRASSVGILGLERFNNKDYDDVTDAVPDYMRPPDIRAGK